VVSYRLSKNVMSETGVVRNGAESESGQCGVQRPEWAPEDVDMDSPSPARVYDALLGGSHNFEVDRRAAQAGTKMVPELPITAAANRRFLRRAVTHLADSGIRQFVDIGAGIPTVGNTHEIVQAIDPAARVVYVDIDAIAVAHASSLLADNDRALAMRGDLRAPEELLTSIEQTGLVDLSEPVGLLMVAVLHLIPDADHPADAVATLRDAVASKSQLVISHLTSEGHEQDADRLSSAVARRDRVSLIFRPRQDIEAFFADFRLVPPGLTRVAEWRPDPAEEAVGSLGRSLILAGVGSKD
jgi:S-adenosyl methyltransferase